MSPNLSLGLHDNWIAPKPDTSFWKLLELIIFEKGKFVKIEIVFLCKFGLKFPGKNGSRENDEKWIFGFWHKFVLMKNKYFENI